MDNQAEERRNVVMSLQKEVFGLHEKYSKSMTVATKGNPKDLVTNADRAIEKLIVEKITKNFPNDKIVGEEYGISSKGTNGFVWYIDPIDGTLNFVQGFNNYGTSIGLVSDGEIVFGAIFSAEDNNTYWAAKGKGAYCNKKRINVSKKDKLSDFCIQFDLQYNSDAANKTFDTLKKIYPKIRAFRHTGCCVCDLIKVATGKADVYWAQEFLKPHDFCAGAIIVKEAGGFVSHEDAEKFITPEQGSLFATNGKLHKEIVNMVLKEYSKK